MLGLFESSESKKISNVEDSVRFEVIDNYSIPEDKSILRKRSRGKKRPNLYQQNFRFELDEYEYLARLAKNTPANSRQRIVAEIMFRPGWRNELEAMRAQHRKLGYKDVEFYPREIQERMGFKSKPGRRPRTFIRRRAA